MDEAYAVKQTQFLGKSVHYICQNLNGPCPLLAIANVLLLRGQVTLDTLIDCRGFVNAHTLMKVIYRHLVDTNPPLSNAMELQRLTQEKTLRDVEHLLPNLCMGLDVNVRFHKITDFEYTVACAVFDMLDIVLVHGWLLDEQDDSTMKVVGNKSYNELIERLVDYRGVIMTEVANMKTAVETEEQEHTESSLDMALQLEEHEQENKVMEPPADSLPAPQATDLTEFQNLSIENNSIPDVANATRSSNSTASISFPSKNPSQQTVQTMMKERHISDADALDTARTLMEEGPILEDFFNSTASQLTYYGLVKLHEGLRERQLCVFFRNNHFSTLFKFEGALYLLVTDAGYLDEPTVVWELLNEIDGDTEYLDAQFRSVTSSEQQKNILTQQQRRQLEQEQTLQSARNMSRTRCVSPNNAEQKGASESDTPAAEPTMPSGGLFGEAATDVDPDYLLALKFQQEEETLARGNRVVSPRHRQSIGTDSIDAVKQGQADENGTAEGNVEQSETSGQDDGYTLMTSVNELVPVAADEQILISKEELEAQREAELYYQEQKRKIDAETLQYQQEQEQIRQQQQLQQQRTRSGQRQKSSDGSDCIIS